MFHIVLLAEEICAMKKKVCRMICWVMSALLLTIMMPAFSFADTYAEKAWDGEYHYTGFGDSVAAGRGAAEDADADFLALGYRAGVIEDTLNASPEKGYVNLLADKLNNHIYAKPEGESNFVRNSCGNWENRDADSIFTFSNASFLGVGTKIFLDFLTFCTKSDEPAGTDEYYKDLFMKNFCNEKGEYISNTPLIYTFLFREGYINEDGTVNKAAFGRFCSNNSKTLRDELNKADVLTLGLGSNDMLVNSVYSLNELLKGDESGIFDALNNVLLGRKGGLSDVDFSKMSDETLIKLLQFTEPAAIIERADKQVENGLECYEKILEMIKAEKKGNHSVALVGLYKPYGEEFETGGKKNVFPVLAGDILDSLSDLIESSEYRELSCQKEKVSAAVSSVLEDAVFSWIAKTIYAETGINFTDLRMDKEQLERALKEFKGDSAEYRALFKKMMKNSVRYSFALREVKGANKAQKALIKEMLMEKIRMPLMYALLGTTTNASIDRYNEGIEKLADKFGYSYVDISDLAADDDPNTHPDLAGHRLIAKRAFEALKSVVPPIIKTSDIKILKTAVGRKCIKVRYSAKNKGNASGYTVQYKVKGAEKWKRFKNTESTFVKIKKLKTGKKYAVRVRAYNRNSFETVYGNWKHVTSKKVK